MTPIETPVAYLVYNRPKHVAKTFEAIRSARPGMLFLIADGPKPGSETDVAKCRQVREILESIDWPCKVFRNYAERNLGLKARISSGLDWVFSEVDRAIILEDDCLPHPDFFDFCDSLLHKYETDDRVWVITGDNFQNGKTRGNASYYYSKHPHCWGWATWKRAWRHFKPDIPFWPEWSRSENWNESHSGDDEEEYWRGIFQNVYVGKINSWNYPWTACVWYHRGLTATPNVNLVTNIGFGAEGTHCLHEDNSLTIPTQGILPIRHPSCISKDTEADRFASEKLFIKKKVEKIDRKGNLFRGLKELFLRFMVL